MVVLEADDSAISHHALHPDEEDLCDDMLSDTDALASLDGEIFSDEEDNLSERESAVRPKRGWKVEHSSGNYKYKRLLSDQSSLPVAGYLNIAIRCLTDMSIW